MTTKKMSITTAILLSVLTVMLCQILGKTNEVWAVKQAGTGGDIQLREDQS